MKLLLIENNEDDIAQFTQVYDTYCVSNELQPDLNICRTVTEALECTKSENYDGIVVDLKLKSNIEISIETARLLKEGKEFTPDMDADGSTIIQMLHSSLKRTPIIILSGTPSLAEENGMYLKAYTKGEIALIDIVTELHSIHDTGITDIVGGKGILEQTITEIFFKNILPQLEIWASIQVDDKAKKKKALLRHFVNHMAHQFENDNDEYFPAEFYIIPPHDERYRTGSILKFAESYFVVVSPACDLAGSSCSYKTDRILLAEVTPFEKLIQPIKKSAEKNPIEDYFDTEVGRLKKNSRELYYHWIPPFGEFPGGAINFRKINSHKPSEIAKNGSILMQITLPFTKDIVSRLSSYYARQGQPVVCNP